MTDAEGKNIIDDAERLLKEIEGHNTLIKGLVVGFESIPVVGQGVSLAQAIVNAAGFVFPKITACVSDGNLEMTNMWVHSLDAYARRIEVVSQGLSAVVEKARSRGRYLLNAFSLQMDESFPVTIKVEEISALPEGLVSAIGHADIAAILGVPMRRINVTLKPGDIAYVAQLQGGRLPEGSTKLPEGFSFKFYQVTIVE
jgi:hypothetical protein